MTFFSGFFIINVNTYFILLQSMMLLTNKAVIVMRSLRLLDDHFIHRNKLIHCFYGNSLHGNRFRGNCCDLAYNSGKLMYSQTSPPIRPFSFNGHIGCCFLVYDCLKVSAKQHSNTVQLKNTTKLFDQFQ